MQLNTLFLKKKPHQLFLIDGIGAVVSASMLGLVLVALQTYVGLPVALLQKLAIIACFFALYSFSCYWAKPRRWPLFLTAIGIANLLYGAYTLFVISGYWSDLKILGWLHFITELAIIAVLACFELSVARSGTGQQDAT